MDFNKKWLTIGAAIYFAIGAGSFVMALPNSGSTTTPPPPPPADPYVLILVFNGGDPAAAIESDSETKLPKRYATLNACTTSGANWQSAAANPAGQTVLKFNCVQVKPVGSASIPPPTQTSYLTCGSGICLATDGSKLLAK